MARIEAYVVVTDEDGQSVLLVNEGGEWDLPGGPVTLAESVEAALMRLLKEATGMDVGVGELTGVYQRPQEERIALVFRGTALSGTLNPGGTWARVPPFPEGTRRTVALRVNDALRAHGRPVLRLQ
jgi:ADP-ribose pyrophosphatase YjhB (NUDIX family)